MGFNCEADVWVLGGIAYLGHDEPLHQIPQEFLKNKSLWCHAKNLEALVFLSASRDIKYFWHQSDDYALTSNGFIWTFPGKPLMERSIQLMPEWASLDLSSLDTNCYGICSDYVLKIKNDYF